MIKELNNYVRIRGIGYIGNRDESYNEVKYFKLRYKVAGIGAIGLVDCFYADGAKMRSVVEVGEEVLIRWYGVSEAYDRGSDKYGNYYVSYEDLVCVKRGGKWEGVNDNILVSSEGDNRVSVGVVEQVSNDVEYYVGYNGEKILPTEVNVGDYVLAEFRDMREIEHIDNQEFDSKLFAVQSKDIKLISSKEIRVTERYSEINKRYEYDI